MLWEGIRDTIWAWKSRAAGRECAALYHGVEEWVKEGGLFWEEFTASGLSVATEPREVKSVARRLESAIVRDSCTNFSMVL